MADGRVAFAGSFSAVGPQGLAVTIPATNAAVWDGSGFAPLGSAPPLGRRMLTARNGDLVLGTNFGQGIWRWRGNAWGQLLDPNGFTPLQTNCLTEMPNGDLVNAGGASPSSGAATSLAQAERWDGTSWASLWPAINSLVFAVDARDNDLFVGGRFTQPATNLLHVTATCPAAASQIGSGCAGGGGAMVLTADALPFVGGVFRATATGFGSPALAATVVGSSPSGQPLSSVFPQAYPGCTIPNGADLLFGYQLAQGGGLAVAIPVPNVAALVGRFAYVHCTDVEFDAQLAITGVATTNGLLLQLGTF